MNRLYDATQSGLLQSANGGRTWTDAFTVKRPATMVEVTRDGKVYAFIFGVGLIHAVEAALAWQTLATNWDEDYLLHLAVDPKNTNTLHAVAGKGSLVTSNDGGKTWDPLGAASGQ